ncbi:ricin-type beta-trefoil lectin domain protein [Streptomyces diastatochromogenes]|nr:ricin-type beta-trefoil lectin domain protein [Streptomyces diastatochromogenes]
MGRAEAGAGAVLAGCSSAGSQQWSYQDDGLLRSAADPTLCLAADPGTRGVVVSGCVVHAGEVSYDLTVRGELLLRSPRASPSRRDRGLSTRVVVAARDGSRGSGGFWRRGGCATGAGRPAGWAGRAGPRAARILGGGRRAAAARAVGQGHPEQEAGQGSGQGHGSRPTGSEYETRIAQVGAHEDPGAAESAPPEGPVSEVVSPIAGTVASVPAAVGSLLG